MRINMSLLENEFSDDSKKRIYNLENELEEFKANVSEENLKLKVPYVTDKSGENIGLELDMSNRKLKIYSGDTLIGQISLS